MCSLDTPEYTENRRRRRRKKEENKEKKEDGREEKKRKRMTSFGGRIEGKRKRGEKNSGGSRIGSAGNASGCRGGRTVSRIPGGQPVLIRSDPVRLLPKLVRLIPLT